MLFALIIEPLAQLIRTDPDVKWIELGGHHNKLFSEDILVFMTQPHTSASNLLAILDDFAQISGLHVNPKHSIYHYHNLCSAWPGPGQVLPAIQLCDTSSPLLGDTIDSLTI